MSQPIRYVFFDLDGTLLDDQKNISKRTVELIKIIKTSRNIKFGLATGRALTSLLPILLTNEMEDVIEAVVANNGVELFIPKNNELILLPKVSRCDIKAILDTYQDYPFINVVFHNPGRLYALRRNIRVDYIMKINNLTRCVSPLEDQSYEETPRVMLVIDAQDKTQLTQLVNKVAFKGLQGSFSEDETYEYIIEGISKDKAIKSYVERFQDSLENVAVFGDNDNDIAMISHCGLGIAMINGTQKAKAAASLITQRDNNHEGVYHFMLNHLDLFF